MRATWRAVGTDYAKVLPDTGALPWGRAEQKTVFIAPKTAAHAGCKGHWLTISPVVCSRGDKCCTLEIAQERRVLHTNAMAWADDRKAADIIPVFSI